MPIPILIGIVALATAGYGVKKGYDAKTDYDTAQSINEDAELIYEDAEDKLISQRDRTQNSIEALGVLKFIIYNNSIIPFINEFTKIKNIENSINIEGVDHSLPSNQNMIEMKKQSLELQEIVGGGLTALGAGGLAGLAAYGGVGLLATASTGTAIAGLSGVAATNATLAWLGGGSLATGGFGMAAGTVVLGGIVAAPVLAVGGMILASKAEAAKEDAYANLEVAELAAEEMKTARSKLKGIRKKVLELAQVLFHLDNLFKPYLKFINELTTKNTDYRSYTQQEKERLFIAFSIYNSLENILNVTLLTKKGNLRQAVRKSIKETTSVITETPVILNKNKTNSKKLKSIVKKYIKPIYKELDTMYDINFKSDEEHEKYKPEDYQGTLLISFQKSWFYGRVSIYFSDVELYVDDFVINLDEIYSIWIDEDDKLHINENIFRLNNEENLVAKAIVNIIQEYTK